MCERLLAGVQSGVDTADIVDALSSLFELVHRRSVYLHCLNDETSKRASTNRPSVQAAAATTAGLYSQTLCSVVSCISSLILTMKMMMMIMM